MVPLIAMVTMMPQGEPADTALKAAIPVAQEDPDRPRFHYHAPAQWMNDPNGPIFYKGWYHLFYQLNPFGDQWDHMHWGHTRSKDLVHWEDLPIALLPAPGEKHVFSGSVFPGGDGKPMAFYTSIDEGREPEQWIATAGDENLQSWVRDPVKMTQSIHGAKPLAEWRDPFLFTDFGLTYMVVGGGLDGKGIVALYKATSSDLRGWQYLGVLFTHPDADVRNIECPNIALIDGKWVLLVSVHGRVDAFVGELRNTMFLAEHRSVLAEGSYASQLFQGTKERAIHLAWVNTRAHKGWNGFLTLPSELHVGKDGTLLRTPVKELTKLRGKELPKPIGDSLEIEARIDPGTATRLGLSLRSGGLEVAYEPASRRLSVPGRSVVLPEAKELRLRVFLDRTTVDVYANDGAGSLAAHVDHLPGRGNDVTFFSEGGEAKVKSMRAWPIVAPVSASGRK